MKLWRSGKDKDQPPSLKEIWAQMARDLQAVSFDSFVSSQWSPVSDNAPYKTTYLEASYRSDSQWVVQQLIIDDENFATMEDKKSGCTIFEALAYIGEFESTQHTPAAGIPHQKIDDPAAGEHYTKTAHKHALFIDADGMVYLNDNGTPANAKGARFAMDELTLVKALTPQEPQGETLDLPALYTKSATRPDLGFNLSAEIVANYNVSDQLQLMRLGQTFRGLSKHLKNIKSTWTERNRPWAYRKSSNPANAIRAFMSLLGNIADIAQKTPEQHPGLVQPLQIEAQAMYATFITQIINSDNISSLIWAEDKSFFGYEDLDAKDWPTITIQKLEKMISDHKNSLARAGQEAMNYDYVIPMVMADYTPEQYAEIFNDFCNRIDTLNENFAIYKNAKIQSYGQKALGGGDTDEGQTLTIEKARESLALPAPQGAP